MDAPGFPVSMDNGTKWEATMTLKSLAAIEITIIAPPPARNFLNSSYVNLKSLRYNKGEPVFEMHADDAALQQPSA